MFKPRILPPRANCSYRPANWFGPRPPPSTPNSTPLSILSALPTRSGSSAPPPTPPGTVAQRRRALGIKPACPDVRLWTKEEDEFLGRMPDLKAARKLKRSLEAVRHRRVALSGPPFSPKYMVWQPEDDRIPGTRPDADNKTSGLLNRGGAETPPAAPSSLQQSKVQTLDGKRKRLRGRETGRRGGKNPWKKLGSHQAPADQASSPSIWKKAKMRTLKVLRPRLGLGLG